MKLAVLMDPIEKIKAYKDSTVAMLKSACDMGWECTYFTADDIYTEDGQVYANVANIYIKNEINTENWAEISAKTIRALSEFDILLMRKDPPFNMKYIYLTYALELAERAGVIVANKPQSLRDANEKFFTMHFPQCCPPNLVTANIDQLHAFWQTHQQVIFKPLDGMGGRSIFYVDEKGSNLSVILETLTKNQTLNIMAQRYIPAIKTAGDKRILLVNGVPVPYALARIPAEGEIRGNLVAGAQGKVVELNDRDRWICQQIAPTLKAKGLYFVGIDVIGDYLTEINVTSPTCIREISTATGIDIASVFLHCLADLVQTKKSKRSRA